MVLRLAAARPAAAALRATAVRVAPAFVDRVEERVRGVRPGEAAFTVPEAAARAFPAPLALPLFLGAPAAVAFFMRAEVVFLTPAVPRLATAGLLCLPVLVDFAARGMSLLLWHSCRFCRPATKRKTDQDEDAFPFIRNRISRRSL